MAKVSEVALSGCTWIFLVLSFVPFSLYIIKSLADDNPPANWVLLSASNANLLISVLSQIFIFSLSLVFGSMLDVLRWQLASGANGVSLQAFFGLSRATQLLPALRLMRSWQPSLLLFCNYRYSSLVTLSLDGMRTKQLTDSKESCSHCSASFLDQS